MAENGENGRGQLGNRLRVAAWSVAGLVLLMPLIAMQFTDQVVWTAADFAVFGVLLLGAGTTFELAVRMTSNTAYRWAVGIALAGGFLLIWMNGAVGIIGDESNSANLMYGGVLAIALIGAVVARFQPLGMARAMCATALAQALVAVVALVARLGYPSSGALEIVILNGFFVGLFLGSAWLFRSAARKLPSGDAENQA